MKTLKYFHTSFIVTFIGMIGGFCVGYIYGGTLAAAFTSLFLTIVLGILEVSLSFDNAVVNATVLKDMTPKWRHRFITWGILIAVFGMRIVFPLAIVCVIAWVNPWEAIMMATFEPAKYQEVMLSSHIPLAGFGGTFLLMVGLAYFFNPEKDVHWLNWLEKPLAKIGKAEAAEIAVCLMILMGIAQFLPNESRLGFIEAGMWGLVTFVIVDSISSFLKLPDQTRNNLDKASAAMFLYLEILDASFSFDGVIGAFALTNNLFIIAIGLGIGAMFVRSMTIMLVEKETLNQFRYLEHGAFYAIFALAMMMLLDVFVYIPEVVTGLIGAILIGLSIWSSVLYNRKKTGQTKRKSKKA